MRILILEDEPIIAKNLAKMVLKVKPDAHLVEILHGVGETLAWFQRNPLPDLIIADIQLSDGVSFKALESIEQSVPVIFTTAFDEYALKAFKINSVDYLLKPVNLEMLKEAFDKFERIVKKYNNPDFLKGFSDLLQGAQSHSFKRRFLVYSGMQMIPLEEEQIAAFRKLELIFVVDSEGKQYITEYRSLDEIQELIDPEVFFRANRQVLINRKFISKIHSDESNKIHVYTIVKETDEIMVSKEKASEFKKWLGK